MSHQESNMKIPLKNLIKSHIDEKKLFYSMEISPKCDININFPGFVDKPLFINLTWFKDSNLQTALEDSKIIKLGKSTTEIEVVHSVTCYNMTDSKLDEFLKEESVVNLNVLRGDLVNDEQKYEHANDLILAIKRKMAGVKELTIFAAGYPQTHPEATSFELDLMYLEKKVRGGVDVIITQVVYSADVFLEFLYNCRSLNIEIPIIPGLYMPRNFEDLKEMIRITKVQLPDGYYEEYRKHRNNDNAFHKFSVLSTLSVMREITKNCSEHIPGFHFYTMNNFSMIQTLLELKDYWSNHE